MSDQIRETALLWAQAVNTRKPENVLALYHPDGLLWGTLSPIIRHGRNTIHDYFVSFLNREDLSCSFTDGITRIHGDFAFYSGSYVFSWRTGRKMIEVPARFSFIYINEGGKWLIMEHHSSLFPELPFKIRKYIRA